MMQLQSNIFTHNVATLTEWWTPRGPTLDTPRPPLHTWLVESFDVAFFAGWLKMHDVRRALLLSA